MPRNFKEEAVFTAIMAGLMVFVMVCYNVVLVQGFTKAGCWPHSPITHWACWSPSSWIC